MTQTPVFSASGAATVAAERGAAPADRLYAARALVDRGLIAGVPAALSDLAESPEHLIAVRKLVQQIKFVEQTLRWLDFEGREPREGRWESPDGRVPAEALASVDALMWVHPGAERTVIAFSHVQGGFGPMAGWHSVGLVHRILRPLGVNVVYLLDEPGHLHFGLIRGLGDDYSSGIDRLKALLAERGWSRTYAFGPSSGGFSALRFGLDLEAQAVLSMSGPTDLDVPDPAHRDPRLLIFYRDLPRFAVDLLPLYRANVHRPRLIMCYGQLNDYDRQMAERMTELGETALAPFDGFAGHSTFVEGLRNGRLGPLLRQLITDA